jgi:hypothetical protein
MGREQVEQLAVHGLEAVLLRQEPEHGDGAGDAVLELERHTGGEPFLALLPAPSLPAIQVSPVIATCPITPWPLATRAKAAGSMPLAATRRSDPVVGSSSKTAISSLPTRLARISWITWSTWSRSRVLTS